MFTPFAFIQPTVLAAVAPPTALNYLLIGGSFTTYNIPNPNRIAKIDTNGDLDPSFNMGSAGFNNSPLNIAQQPDGKYVVGGIFTGYSGSSVARITRLNQDGTRDISFNVGTGAVGGNVNIISPQNDNSNVIGGNFTTYSGSSINRIVKITSSGSRDTTFNVGTGFSNSVYDMITQSDGKIIAVGDFTTYSGSNSNRIVRINTDGTRDTTFNVGTGANSSIISIKLQSSGKIIIAGGFSQYSGSTINRIARLNTDGTLDTSFNVGTGLSSDALSIDIQQDDKILAIGGFTTYSGSSINRIIRINTDGTRDTTFDVGTGLGDFFNSATTCQIAVSSNGKVYVTNLNGTTYNDSFVGNLIRINSNGSLDTTFVTTSSISYNPPVAGLMGQSNAGGNSLILSGSSVIVVGAFNSYKDPVFNRGLMIDSTGAISSSFNIGINNRSGLGFNSTVFSFVTQSDGKILAGGGFTNYSGSSINRIVRINTDGTIDTTFNIGTGFNSTIGDLKVQPDGKIIAIGSFTTYSGSSVNAITRINTDGTRDTTFNIGNGFQTLTGGNYLALQPDGKIIAVGGFTLYSGSTSNRIVLINTDGTRDTTFNVGTGLNNSGDSVLLQPDGKIIVVGSFTTYSGSSTSRIVRINTDGTRDTTFNVGTGLSSTGYALAYQSDGKIVFANASQQYSGSTARFIIRINPSGTLDTTFNANIGGSISTVSPTANALKIDNNGKIYWGNAFTTFSGSFTPNRIVRLNTNGSVDETFNQAFPNFPNSTGKGANSTVNAILLL
jgi:uncharacterized delta-60 repeat protein